MRYRCCCCCYCDDAGYFVRRADSRCFYLSELVSRHSRSYRCHIAGFVDCRRLPEYRTVLDLVYSGQFHRRYIRLQSGRIRCPDVQFTVFLLPVWPLFHPSCTDRNAPNAPPSLQHCDCSVFFVNENENYEAIMKETTKNTTWPSRSQTGTKISPAVIVNPPTLLRTVKRVSAFRLSNNNNKCRVDGRSPYRLGLRVGGSLALKLHSLIIIIIIIIMWSNNYDERPHRRGIFMWHYGALIADKGISAVAYVRAVRVRSVRAVAFSWYNRWFNYIHQMAPMCSPS